MVTVRAATMLDLQRVASRMRPEDAAEVWAAAGQTPYQALREGYLQSRETLLAETEDGLPLAVFGVAPVPEVPEMGAVWLLGTTSLPRAKLTALRDTPKYLERWHRWFPLLGNLVDARNALHIRWLQAVGFHFLRVVWGVGDELRPFLEFAHLPKEPSLCALPPPSSPLPS